MFDTRLYPVLKFAMEKHEGQLRDDGQPYMVHPIAVSMILAEHGLVSYNTQAIALLHDVLEDCPGTSVKHIERLAGRVVARNVEVLTKQKGVSLETYYDQIQQYHIAAQVKIADRIHNLHSMKDAWDPNRIKKYITKTERYYTSWAFDHFLLAKEFQNALTIAEELGE